MGGMAGPWVDVLKQISRQFRVDVTSEFGAGLLFADLHRTDIVSKQRLEFLVVADCPSLSDEWNS